MKCPHCLVEFHQQWATNTVHPSFDCIGRENHAWMVHSTVCPACRDVTIKVTATASTGALNLLGTFQVYPRSTARAVPSEVPADIGREFIDACKVLGDSQTASAALSRRCLQNILLTAGGATKKDLYDQIEEVMPSLPADVADSLHAVRNIGNFAAHPMKSKSTGLIVEVEEGEAEWNLDTLEELFDFYYVRPAAHAKRKAALNAKLTQIGKPTI